MKERFYLFFKIDFSRILFFVLVLAFPIFVSCTKELDNDFIWNSDKESQDSDRDYPDFTSFAVALFAGNSVEHQSAACYRDYCVMVTQGRGVLSLYNLASKEMLCKTNLIPGKGLDFLGSDLYHCNQTSFGVDFYDINDFFPLIYISQRAGSDKRCFVEVFRLLPTKSETDSDFTSMTVSLVQTICFPAMTMENSLGNVNCVIDSTNHRLYTYSRNKTVNDANYGLCKISYFDIPEPTSPWVVLDDADILDSFILNCSAINMQGGCILDGLLYIVQGYASVGIYFNVVDLERRVLVARIDMLAKGMSWEPEGCFVFNENVMVSSGTEIWSIIWG